MDIPRLIDNNARFFLYHTLQQCHENRVHLYNIALNIGVFLLFVSVTGSILYYNYKKKPTEYEAREKLLREQQYILSKIRFFQSENSKKNISDITNLPMM